MRLPRLSPAAYRRITLIAAVLLAVIIVTGGAVRITGSGLGCPRWPNCTSGSLVPRNASDGHAMVEFVNRVFTGAVSIVVILAVLGSFLRVPRRRDLIWLSVGLVVGVIVQAVIGGLAVIYELRPEVVMTHFLVSLALLTNAMVLHRRAGEPRAPAEPVVVPQVRLLGRVLLGAAAAVVIIGTIVTSTGPHGGDRKAKRFTLELPQVARAHGAAVIFFLGVALLTLWALRRTRAPVVVQRRLELLFLVSVAQAGIGYYQYFNDIPALAVGFHIAGATAVWAATVAVYQSMFWRPPPAVDQPTERAPAAAREALATA
ncbi:MAG: heme A synthase [Actinobacteria bacterium]|nr:MAG: heme A synthase [Actinomycetota bacterium]